MESARGFMNDGQYRQAIPRLLFALEKSPEDEYAAECWYLLAKSYESIDCIKDSADAFKACMDAAPDGRFAQESRERIESLSSLYRERYPEPEALDAKIVTLLDELEREPDDVKTGLALADALWMRGRYDDAARVYVELAKNDSSVRRSQDFQSRVELGKGGGLTVLTPQELDRRNSKRHPIEITETNGFRAGRDLLSLTPRFYVVTGQAVNRADSVLYGVAVEVTIHGFGGAVFDTGEASIGTLYPRESRAFSVRLSEFPDINQVESYRCTARFRLAAN